MRISIFKALCSADLANKNTHKKWNTEKWKKVLADKPYPPAVESNSKCSITENTPPKGVSFSDFIITFAMSVKDCLIFRQH